MSITHLSYNSGGNKNNQFLGFINPREVKMDLVAESLDSDLSVLENYESVYRENDKGELRLYTDSTLSQTTLQELEDKITSGGVHLTEPITQDARVVFIRFKKGIAPLLIIGGAVAAVIAGLLGWQLFKEPFGVPWWVWIVGGVSLAYLLLRKPVKKAAPYAIKAGKVYLTRKIAK